METTIIQHNIKFVREYLNLTQSQLGDEIGVTADQVEKFENRGTRPKLPIIDNLSKSFALPKEVLTNIRLDRDLYEKHFDEKLSDIPQSPIPLVEEPEEPYEKKPNSIEALFRLVESNKILSESNKTLAEANKKLADNTVTLTHAYTNLTAGGGQENSKDVLATVQALQEYVAEIGSKVKKTSVAETAAELGILMSEKRKGL